MIINLKALKYILQLKCPKCRKGHLFVNNNPYRLRTLNVMRKNCQVCNLKYVIEPGFYLGAAYVSYALQVVTGITVFFLLNSFDEVSVNWIVFIIALAVTLASPYYIVLSRSFWIYFFVPFDETYK